jgi:hypothetical protein
MYYFWEYTIPDHKEFATLEAALRQAKTDVEYNYASPDKIVLEDGRVLEHEEILHQSGYYTKSKTEEENPHAH